MSAKASRLEASGAKTLSRLLTGGIAAGCALVAIGGVLLAFQGGLQPGTGIGSTGFAVLEGMLRLDGATFIRAGVLVLIVTPILRVVVVAALMLRRDDRAGVVYSIVVLLLLALATALELRH